MKSNAQVEWLLQDNQPAVKYLTLSDLLDRTPSDSELKEVYAKIPEKGWAASILQRQDPKGTWASGFYQPKYLATNWQLLVLSDLGLTAQIPAVKKACDLYLAEVSGPKGDLGGSGRRRPSMCR